LLALISGSSWLIETQRILRLLLVAMLDVDIEVLPEPGNVAVSTPPTAT